MKSAAKTVLGIDIGHSHVNTVVLKRTAQGLKVLSCRQRPTTDGMIEGGRVVDLAQLLKILKTAKRGQRMGSKRVSLSLPVKSTLARVVPLAESDPQKIVQFVQDEVRQYAIFSGRETVSDFRVLVPAKAQVPGRVLVTAADYEATSALASICQKAGIVVETMEPAVIVCTRMLAALDASRSAFANTMFALLKDQTLTLCVFKKGRLDFVHAKGTGPEGADMAVVHEWVANELNAVVQFYNLESHEVNKSWNVVVADDQHAIVPPEAAEVLRAMVKASHVEVLSRSNVFERFSIAAPAEAQVSITAVGLAMGTLNAGPDQISVNLLPQEADKARVVRRGVLVIANVLAVMVLAVVLVIGAIKWQVDRVNRDITAMRVEEVSSRATRLPAAVMELGLVKERLAAVSAEVDCATHIASSRFDADWVQLLNDVRDAVPYAVLITDLSMHGTSELVIEGVSKTLPAVRTFRDQLAQSRHIRSSEVKSIRNSTGALAEYRIECVLVAREML